jgi:hypothetical protein
MKYHIFKKINIALLCFMIIAGVSVTSCKKDEEKDVKLYSFGPSPVLRGNDIKFIGQNLNLVTSVVLPDNISISEITVVSESEISVTVPQEAQEGKVILNYSGGSITTKSNLGFTEPYEITSIAPLTSVRAGEEVTINGDYLNNIVKVVFQPNAVVEMENFVSHSRKQIKLLVPKEAASGKIIVEDFNENQLYSDQELTISLPEITEVSPLTVKAGQNITISGANLDLVSSIVFQGGTTVEAADFVSQAVEELVVTAPANLQDGSFTMVSYSTNEIVSTQELTAVVPSNIFIQPVTRYKTGLEVIVSGADLDLVTSVQFAGAAEVTDFVLGDTTITLAISNDAIDGAVTLNTASGKTANTSEIVLVKPVVEDLTPNPVTAGNTLSLVGTDLDLVISIGFMEDVVVEISPESETNIEISVPIDASTGPLALNMINGTSVSTSEVTINSPEFCFIPVLPSDTTQIIAGDVFAFDIVNGDVLTDVTFNGSSSQFIVQGDVMHVMIPSNAGGATDMNLISSNGDVTYVINVTGSGVTETVVWEGPLEITWGDGGRVFVPESAFDGVPVGAIMKIYFTQKDVWGQAQINNGNWSVIPFAELGNDGYMTTNTYNDVTVSEQELVLTQDVLDNITSNMSGGNAIIIQGSDWIINKISIIVTAPSSEVIWEGEQVMGNWAGWVQLSSDLFATTSVGQTLSVSFKDLDPASDYWQVALKHGADWSDIEIVNVEADATNHEWVIDESLLSIMQSDGIIFQGAFYTLTKVEIK